MFPKPTNTTGRKKQCFVSHDSSIGYWLRLGNLISRIEGFDPHRDYFLVRDYDDKSYLLTRDGSAFHPIADGEAEAIIRRAEFRKAVTFHEFKDKSQAEFPVSSDRDAFFADQDFVYSIRESDETGETEKRVVSLWSSS